MNKKIKIAVGIIKLFSKKAKKRFEYLKSEYENIVLNIDKTVWHSIEEKPTENKTIIFYLKHPNSDNHDYAIMEFEEIGTKGKKYINILFMGAKYWAYCDDLFNI